VSSDADRKQNGIQCVRGSDLKLRISTKALKHSCNGSWKLGWVTFMRTESQFEIADETMRENCHCEIQPGMFKPDDGTICTSVGLGPAWRFVTEERSCSCTIFCAVEVRGTSMRDKFPGFDKPSGINANSPSGHSVRTSAPSQAKLR